MTLPKKVPTAHASLAEIAVTPFRNGLCPGAGAST
jgi:hypothetical protein